MYFEPSATKSSNGAPATTTEAVVHTDAQAEMAVRAPPQVQLERIGELAGRVRAGSRAVPGPNSVPGVDEVTGAPSEQKCAAVSDANTDAVVVAVRGEIDMLTEPELRRVLHEGLSRAAGRALVVDLTDVSFFSSTGIAALVEAHSLARTQDTRVSLVVTPDSPPDRSLTAMGLASRWAIHHTRTSALRHTSRT
jgi:anti-anti-sigma factor